MTSRYLLALATMFIPTGYVCAHTGAGADTPARELELPRPEDGYHQAVEVVAPGVWVLSQPKFQVQPIGNVVVVEQADGLVMFDAGGSPGAGRRLVASVKKLSDKPVKLIVISHWHGDHVQGLSEILRAWPDARTLSTQPTQMHLRTAKTMNSPAEFDEEQNRRVLSQIDGLSQYVTQMRDAAVSSQDREDWGAAARLLNQYRADSDGALTIAPLENFAGTLQFPDPERPIAVTFPGRANTDGDAVLWLPKQRIVAAGDIVVLPFPYGSAPYLLEWRDALKQLASSKFAALIPGHGAVQRNDSYLVKLDRALSEALGEAREVDARRTTAEDARARISSTQAALFDLKGAWQRRWFEEFWVKPILAAALKEVRQEPVVQSLGS